MLTNPTAVLMIGGLPIHRLAVDAGTALTEELLDQVAGGVFGGRPGVTRPRAR